jgi:hypothetical protein
MVRKFILVCEGLGYRNREASDLKLSLGSADFFETQA